MLVDTFREQIIFLLGKTEKVLIITIKVYILLLRYTIRMNGETTFKLNLWDFSVANEFQLKVNLF